MGKKKNTAKEILHRAYKKMNNHLRLDMEEYKLCMKMHYTVPDDCVPLNVKNEVK